MSKVTAVLVLIALCLAAPCFAQGMDTASVAAAESVYSLNVRFSVDDNNDLFVSNRRGDVVNLTSLGRALDELRAIIIVERERGKAEQAEQAVKLDKPEKAEKK